jgi:hypothetical protein
MVLITVVGWERCKATDEEMNMWKWSNIFSQLFKLLFIFSLKFNFISSFQKVKKQFQFRQKQLLIFSEQTNYDNYFLFHIITIKVLYISKFLRWSCN